MTGVQGSPLIVEVTRGSQVESRHNVDAVVVDGAGDIVEGWGDVRTSVLPRSALKPIQALPLIETGAADHYELTDAELALACASHNGEPAHAELVERWLATIGLSEDRLECGAHPPYHAPSAHQLIGAGLAPGPRHNNCSGKHLGFLSVCRHLGLRPTGYIRPDHPLQRDHVTPTVEEVCMIDVSGQAPAIDGCGIPVWSIGLAELAGGWVRLPRRQAGARLLAAMRAEPFFVAGTDRACTRILKSAGAGTVVKTGAEGVYCGVVPERELGIALKARDGGSRASEAAVGWILGRLGLLDEDGSSARTNWAGTIVGRIQVRSRQ